MLDVRPRGLATCFARLGTIFGRGGKDDLWVVVCQRNSFNNTIHRVIESTNGFLESTNVLLELLKLFLTVLLDVLLEILDALTDALTDALVQLLELVVEVILPLQRLRSGLLLMGALGLTGSFRMHRWIKRGKIYNR